MPIRRLLALTLTLGLAACGPGDLPARNLIAGPDLADPAAAAAGRPALAPRYTVTEIRSVVPRRLDVSEANSFYPVADIVWRGEAPGDRYAQVARIFREGMTLGVEGLAQGPEVIVEAEVTRFHSLTEKTRYTVGGVHSIRFLLTVRDAASGQVIDGPRKVVADVRASGGGRAIAEDRAGLTQRVVIVEAIAKAIRRELSGATDLPRLVEAEPGPAGAQTALP